MELGISHSFSLVGKVSVKTGQLQSIHAHLVRLVDAETQGWQLHRCIAEMKDEFAERLR